MEIYMKENFMKDIGNGTKLEGNWDEDNLHGDVKKIYPDGKIKELLFQNGNMLG